MYKIGTLNKISPVGLARFTDDYTVTENIDEANGIILRSYNMHEMDLSENLLAVGRAGAGVNNIPLDKCAEQGIVVFNAPGANANAVKELCLAGMLMAARMFLPVLSGLQLSKTRKAWEKLGKRQRAVCRNRDKRKNSRCHRSWRHRSAGSQCCRKPRYGCNRI